MQTLDWEHGAAPGLRKSLETALIDIGKKQPSVAARKVSALVALRFRRAAVEVDTTTPSDYKYSIDVAELKAIPNLVGSMLMSRQDGASTHYDIVRVHVVLPTRLGPTVKKGKLAGGPMTLELIADTNFRPNRSGPVTNDTVMTDLTEYEAVKDLEANKPPTLPDDVYNQLVLDANNRETWIARPARLMGAYGLRAALALAMNADNSPNTALADYMLMWDNPFIAPKSFPIIWYESLEEQALPLFENFDATCSLLITPSALELFKFVAPGPELSGQVIKLLATKKEEMSINKKTEYSIADLRVAGSGWSKEQSIKILQANLLVFFDVVASTNTLDENAELINTEITIVLENLQTLLVNVRKGFMFDLFLDESSHPKPEHVILSRDKSIAHALFPAPVQRQLIACIVGAWVYHLFEHGVDHSPFWAAYCRPLASTSNNVAQTATILNYLKSYDEEEAVRRPNIRNPFTRIAPDEKVWDETTALNKALVNHVLPVAGVYASMGKK